MTTENEIKKVIKRLNNQTTADMDKRILDDVYSALDDSIKCNCNHEGFLRRIIMLNRRYAIAAIMITAALISVVISNQSIISEPVVVSGPNKYVLADGSQLEIQAGASVELYKDQTKRGFKHIQGNISVQVVKGLGEFVVTTPHGKVKALGTEFTLDLVKDNSFDFLGVNVSEGSVELSNDIGTTVIKEKQQLKLQAGQKPYNFRKDKSLPPRLIERIDSMLYAMETGDREGWLKNFNTDALFDLATGKIKYADHKDWFSGMDQSDADRFIKAFAKVNSAKQMIDMMKEEVTLDSCKIYIEDVSVDTDGKHAKARAVRNRGNNRYTLYTPKWTYYDNDWWQTDD